MLKEGQDTWEVTTSDVFEIYLSFYLSLTHPCKVIYKISFNRYISRTFVHSPLVDIPRIFLYF